MRMKIAHGTYRHYKGSLYVVIGHALHTETEEEHVIYRRADAVADPDTTWIRPVKNFCELVEIDGRLTPRFTWTGRFPSPEEEDIQSAGKAVQQQMRR